MSLGGDGRRADRVHDLVRDDGGAPDRGRVGGRVMEALTCLKGLHP